MKVYSLPKIEEIALINIIWLDNIECDFLKSEYFIMDNILKII